MFDSHYWSRRQKNEQQNNAPRLKYNGAAGYLIQRKYSLEYSRTSRSENSYRLQQESLQMGIDFKRVFLLNFFERIV